MGKRRAQYEEALSSDPLDYDTWFDYARLEEAQVGVYVCVWCVCWCVCVNTHEFFFLAPFHPLLVPIETHSTTHINKPTNNNTGGPCPHPRGVRAGHRAGAARAGEAVSGQA